MPEEKNNNNLSENIEEIKKVLVGLNQKIDEQNIKVGELENKIAVLESYDKAPFCADEAGPPSPPPPPKPESFKDKIAGGLAGAMRIDSYIDKDASGEIKDTPPQAPEIAPLARGEDMPAPPTPDEISTTASSLEERIGGKWFAKIGIGVLLLGVSFFLKYAFDNNWVGPTGRVIIGIFCGLFLLGIGEKTIRKYNYWGQIVTGGGIGMLYLSIYAALNFYSLIPESAAAIFMALVTAVGIILSLRYDSIVLIMVSVLGGFATPFLVSSGENRQLSLFSYILLLDLAILAISIFRKWRWLNLVGFVGTFIVFSAWHEKFYTEDQLFSTLIFLTLFFVIYSISSLIFNLVKKENSTGIEQALTLLTGAVYFAAGYSLLDISYHAFLGFFTFLLAFYYFIWAYLVREVTPRDSYLYNFLAFFSIGFLTLAIPIQFQKFTITLAWIVEAIILSGIGTQLKDKKGDIIKIFGLVVFGLALVRVVFVDYAYYAQTDMLFLNKVFLSALFAVAGSYIITYFFKRYVPLNNKEENSLLYFDKESCKKLVIIFLTLASILTVFAVSRDIVVYHENQVKLENARVRAENAEIRKEHGNFAEYEVSVNQDRIKDLRERSHACLAFFWFIYGIIIAGLGMYKKHKQLIVIGIVLNSAMILKLFFYDLWELETYYRTLIAVNGILAAYLMAVLFYEYNKGEGQKEIFLAPKKTFVIFIVAANILTIAAISREIVVHYDKQTDVLQKEVSASCYGNYKSKLVLDDAACGAIRGEIKTIENRASISISIFWLIYSIVLVSIGFIRRYKWVRIGGILLLLISIFKLFFYDLWSLGQLYRIVASVSLGLVLLGISFAYNKYSDIFKDLLNDEGGDGSRSK